MAREDNIAIAAGLGASTIPLFFQTYISGLGPIGVLGASAIMGWVGYKMYTVIFKK